MQRKLRLGRTGALIALTLASCSTAAPQPGAAILKAWAQFKACTQPMIDKPEYAALRVHTLDLDTMQPTPAQLADETIPSERDAQLFAARFDDVNPCRESLLTDISVTRPDLAPVLADQFNQSGAIALLVADRKITWAEAARRSETQWSDVRQRVAAADLEWIGYLNPFHQPTMEQRQAAAVASGQQPLFRSTLPRVTAP